MPLKKLALTLGIALTLPAPLAVAQTMAPPGAATSAAGGASLGIGSDWLADGARAGLVRGASDSQAASRSGIAVRPQAFTLPGAVAEAAQARSPLPGRGYFFRGFGGIWVGSGEGFVLGAGVSAFPLTSDQHEISGNAAFQRVEGSNGFGVDVNYLYNFRLQGGQAFTPFVGAGINVSHFNFDCGDPGGARGSLGRHRLRRLDRGGTATWRRDQEAAGQRPRALHRGVLPVLLLDAAPRANRPGVLIAPGGPRFPAVGASAASSRNRRQNLQMLESENVSTQREKSTAASS